MSRMKFELKPYLLRNQKLINQKLESILAGFDPSRQLIRAMDHSLMAGGKRLRPILCMAAAGICGSDPLIALPASCAIEMIHTYSLIHDDLPAMDDDDLRRGLPTCHKKFTEATAILAGDALLTHAFYVVSNPETYFDVYPNVENRLKVVAKLSQAAGIDGMVEGQMMDMQSFDLEPEDRLAHLTKIHSLKTGRMICASVETGAISAGAGESEKEKLIEYADRIGLAFQVVDDILNIEGDPEIMGKAAGSDELNDKMTFPAIIGMDASKAYARKLVKEAQEALVQFDEIAVRPLQAIAQYIIKRDR